MNNKEFRKLRRRDLIEIIYQYQCREQELRVQNEALQKELCKYQSPDALAANEIFSAAQTAANQYLLELKTIHTELLQTLSENRSSNTL